MNDFFFLFVFELSLQSYMFQMFDAIAFCHTNRILHRDLKPQNLLVDASGNIKVSCLYLMDFVRFKLKILKFVLSFSWLILV